MTDQAYVTAYQKLSGRYNDNQSSMEEYLAGVEKLKQQYLQDNAGVTTLPVVP